MGGLCNNLGMIIHDHPTVKFTPQTIMTTATNWFTTAATLRSAFEHLQREDGSEFWSCTDEAEDCEELQELIHKCHDDELPNDWRYQTIVNILDKIAEYGSDTEWDDAAHAITDGCVSIYNAELAAWIAENGSRLSYCDEAMNELVVGPEANMSQRLMAGQFQCINPMVHHILNALELIK